MILTRGLGFGGPLVVAGLGRGFIVVVGVGTGAAAVAFLPMEADGVGFILFSDRPWRQFARPALWALEERGSRFDAEARPSEWEAIPVVRRAWKPSPRSAAWVAVFRDDTWRL